MFIRREDSTGLALGQQALELRGAMHRWGPSLPDQPLQSVPFQRSRLALLKPNEAPKQNLLPNKLPPEPRAGPLVATTKPLG